MAYPWIRDGDEVTRREQAERSRELMLDAAADAFWRNGLEATRIQDVLDRTNMTRGAVYHHFSDKVDLATVLARREAERWPEVTAAIAESGVRGLAALHAFVRAVADRLETEVRARAVLRIAVELPDAELAAASFDRWHDFAIRALQQGIADGEISDEIEIRDHAAAFVDALFGACTSQAGVSRGLSVTARAERLWRLLETGLSGATLSHRHI